MIIENKEQFDNLFMILFFVLGLPIYIFLIFLALKSDRPIRNLILVHLLGIFSLPIFVKRKSGFKFDDQAGLEDIKQHLAEELGLTEKEKGGDQALISDLRISYPEVESAVSLVSCGYGVDPFLIIIENSSTLEEIANQIKQHYDQNSIHN